MNTDKNKYNNFEFDDFVLDDDFRFWVLSPDQDDDFWANWINSHPEKKEVVEQSIAFIRQLTFKVEIPSDEFVEAAFNEHIIILRSLRKNWYRKLGSWPSIAGIAASLLFIIGLVFLLNRPKTNNEISYTTDYGQIRSVKLPDGSEVILQANSKIIYNQNKSPNKPREIWLNGEAFFKVRHINTNLAHIKPGERFIVHTNYLNVEVLGTVFDVKERRDISAVVLKSGKVSVELKSSLKQKNLQGYWLLKPGEQVSYNHLIKATIIKKANVATQTAWASGEIVFDGLTMDDLVNYLEDNYGYKVLITDRSILTMQLSGKLKLDSESDLIFVMQNLLRLNVDENGKTLTITRR